MLLSHCCSMCKILLFMLPPVSLVARYPMLLLMHIFCNCGICTQCCCYGCHHGCFHHNESKQQYIMAANCTDNWKIPMTADKKFIPNTSKCACKQDHAKYCSMIRKYAAKCVLVAMVKAMSHIVEFVLLPLLSSLLLWDCIDHAAIVVAAIAMHATCNSWPQYCPDLHPLICIYTKVFVDKIFVIFCRSFSYMFNKKVHTLYIMPVCLTIHR